jgi:hypothetical protein
MRAWATWRRSLLFTLTRNLDMARQAIRAPAEVLHITPPSSRTEPPICRDRLIVGRQREPSVSAHLEDAKPLDDLAKETGPSNKPELGERHPFFVLSFSTMIYGLVGTAAVLVTFFANFWLGMALMALAAAGIALYVRVWVRRQSRS